jgi:predicted nucleic acid-binding protein
VALAWKDSLEGIRRFSILECTKRDLADAWSYFTRRDLHKLSAVDASSFALMKRFKITWAFAFDHHFASAGFRLAE